MKMLGVVCEFIGIVALCTLAVSGAAYILDMYFPDRPKFAAPSMHRVCIEDRCHTYKGPVTVRLNQNGQWEVLEQGQ